ncbi:MAG: hypothetical protein NTV51_26275 [Verrucomicrobia bacterium]|nr:hypothetical protein [Verrucomicrobiota bacterium]
MKVEVPEVLLKLADPYNPANRPPGVALHDASMYRGHYYIYFGAAPVVTLMLPFRVLSGGTALPLPMAVLTFTMAGFLVSVGIFLAIRRRYFPETGIAMTLLWVLALGTASMGPLLVLRSSIWELPLSSGYFYVMLALLGVWRSVHAERRAAWWFAGAALSLGLAVASRPTYLYTTGLLAVPLIWWWMRARRSGGGIPWKMAFAAALPLGAVGLAMAWYNYARFGSPTEFGVAYQFSGIFEAETQHFRWSYLPLNLWMYWLQPAEWTRYFPFLHRAPSPELPAGYLGFDDLYGVLVNLPLVWLALAAPLAAWRRESAGEGAPLMVALGSAAMIAAGTAIPLAFFYAAMARYGADFMPALVLLAATGAVALQRWARVSGGQVRSGLVRAGCAALVVFSVFFAVMLSFEAYGNLRRQSPRAYARLATWFNTPSWLIEKMTGTKHGPLEGDLRWPASWPAAGTREMLVSTGSFAAGDHVFVQYEGAGRVRIGYAHDGGAVEVSRVIAAESGPARRLRVEMGSLYPPEEHGYFTGMKAEELGRLARRLRVELGEEVLLDSYQRFHPSSPSDVAVGHPRTAGRTDKAFSGELVRAERNPGIDAIRAERAEQRTVRVRLAAGAMGKRQPLFSFETGERRAVWYTLARSDGTMSVGAGEGGGLEWESERVSADATLAHEIEVTTVIRSGAASRVMVKLNGVVIGTAAGSVPTTEGAVTVGRNRTAVAEVAAAFDGVIHRTDEGEQVREFDTVRLAVMFPTQRGTERDPLVVTGQTGRGDFLFVEYLDGGRVRFGLDHWGKAPVFSAPLAVDFATPHAIEVSLESFPRVLKEKREPKKIEVKLDGREVWAQEARLFAVGVQEVFVGRNPIGGTACPPLFTGAILEVKRERKPDSVR